MSSVNFSAIALKSSKIKPFAEQIMLSERRRDNVVNVI